MLASETKVAVVDFRFDEMTLCDEDDWPPGRE